MSLKYNISFIFAVLILKVGLDRHQRVLNPQSTSKSEAGMKKILRKMSDTLKHLKVLHWTFAVKKNLWTKQESDHRIYKEITGKLSKALDDLKFYDQLYSKQNRQMILADFLEYIFLGRGYYSIRSKVDKENFVRAILYFVNLLMSYEALTVSDRLRKNFLEKLGDKIPETKKEEYYNDLASLKGKVGLKKGLSDAEHLDKYFDSLLPKTAGGLWHELLVYTFLLRNDFGYVVPLLLSQRLIGLHDSIIPPDFFIIAHDKRIYGIEVGGKKEIQSGAFSLKTAIPTASIDTENSRTSDRCPICKRWILFCDFVINNYSSLDKKLANNEVRCLNECTLYSKEDIAAGKCSNTKYRRGHASTLEHTYHDYTNGLHYHYRCVLQKVPEDMRGKIIKAQDHIALKTHYPYYLGLEQLMKKISDNTT